MEVKELTEEEVIKLKRESYDYDDLNSDGSYEIIYKRDMVEADFEGTTVRPEISVLAVILWKDPYTTALGAWDVTALHHQRHLENLAEPLTEFENE